MQFRRQFSSCYLLCLSIKSSSWQSSTCTLRRTTQFSQARHYQKATTSRLSARLIANLIKGMQSNHMIVMHGIRASKIQTLCKGMCFSIHNLYNRALTAPEYRISTFFCLSAKLTCATCGQTKSLRFNNTILSIAGAFDVELSSKVDIAIFGIPKQGSHIRLINMILQAAIRITADFDLSTLRTSNPTTLLY